MSYDYRYTQKTSRTNTANRPGRRSLYAPPPPPPSRNASHHHGVFTYWLPLIVTGTIAIGGLAAWIWSEREHHHDEDEHHSDSKPPPPRPQTGVGQPYPPQQQPQGPSAGPPPPPPPPGPVGPPPAGGEAASYYDQSQSYRGGQTTTTTTTTTESRDILQQQQGEGENTWYGRVTGMMKRTPSPQNFLESATKQVSAGMAALGSILEDNTGEEEDSSLSYDERREYSSDGRSARRTRNGNGEARERLLREKERQQEGFSDHERWSEEADEQSQRVGVVEAESERRAQSARSGREGGRPRKAVAVVVSADTDMDADDGREDQDGGKIMVEHASILSHLPATTKDASPATDLFVLIYSPTLKALPPLNYRPNTSISPSPSTPAVNTPASELQSISPRPSSPSEFNPSRQFTALYTQALSLVASPTQILPFTTPDGYVHILRHLAPSLVYISDTLSGREGEDVGRLKGWVGHAVLVAGDEGVGGLVDTETETETEVEDGRRSGGKKGKGREVKWYERSDFVGLGKDVEVVDVGRVGEDWGRRVGGRE